MIQRSDDNLKRELNASESRFRSIVQRSADGVVVLDRRGQICFINPAASALLGRSSRQLLGSTFGVPMVPGESAEIDILRGGKSAGVVEMMLVETQWEGEPAYLATLRDVSEHKRIEEEAREAVRRRDAFLATLSHELRNPLAAIANAVDVLAPQLDDPNTDDTVGVLRRQCKQMSRLLDDLLDVSRVSQNKIKLSRKQVDLTQLIGELGKCFQGQFQERGIRLVVQSTGRKNCVYGDYVRLQQIFANLLNNAKKYTPAGGHVCLQVFRDAEDAVVSVRDTGIGIRHDLLDAIFEPFVQDENDSSMDGGGLGIGLALVSKLVEAHQGVVLANSKGPGKGSEFTVRLPISSECPVPEEDTPTTAPLEHQKIVVVEDNRDVREMLKLLLEMDGHEVATAADGEAGVEIIELHGPDIALVDLTMPKLDGIELAKRIRSNAANSRTYLIALTGHGQPDDIRRTKAAGFDAHLVKPIEIDKLNALLAQRHDTVADKDRAQQLGRE
jgi:two-component system CheB/CheR fusion protein